MRGCGNLAETVTRHIENKDSSNIGERVGVQTVDIVVDQAQISDAKVLQAPGT